MKRAFSFFFAVLAFVILAPRASSAQTATFSDGNTIEDALKFVVKCSGVLEDVIFDRGADILRRQKIAVATTITCGTMKDMVAAVEKILPGAYTYHVDRGMLLHILPANGRDGDEVTQAPQPVAPAAAPRLSSLPAPTMTAPVGAVSQRLNMYNVPAVYSPSLGISEAEWTLARNRMPVEPSIMAPPPIVSYGAAYPNVYPQTYAAAGLYGYSAGYNMWSLKGCSNGPAGYVKFNYSGKSGDRKFWNIYLNGEIPGSIDQADSFFNHPIEVCAGHTVVVAEKLGWGPTGKGRNERSFSVRPYVTTEITIGDYLLNMDSHQELQIHVLTEK